MNKLALVLGLLVASPAFAQTPATTTAPGSLLTYPLVMGASAIGTNTAATGAQLYNGLSTGNATNPDWRLYTGLKGSSGTSAATPTLALTIKGETQALGITSSASTALTVGPNAPTNPAFTVDASTASQVAGFKITGAATGGTVALVTTDSGSNNNLTINAKGTGTIGIGSVSTGLVTITPATIHIGQVTVQSTTAPPSAGLATDGLLFSSTANFGVFYGTGAPTFSAAKGSIYIENGTGNPYYNSSGSTTWTLIGSGGGYGGEQHKTTSYTLASTDANTAIDMDCSSACNLTIPASLTNNIQVTINATNSGIVQFVASSTTLNSAVGSTIFLSGKGSSAVINNNYNAGGANQWFIAGNIAP